MNSIILNELCIQHQVSYFVMKLIIKFWVTFIPFFSVMFWYPKDCTHIHWLVVTMQILFIFFLLKRRKKEICKNFSRKGTEGKKEALI